MRVSLVLQMDVGYVGVLLEDLEIDTIIVAHDPERTPKYECASVS